MMTGPMTARGTMDVERGTHWIASILVRAWHLPAAGRAQPVLLDVRPDGDGVIYSRQIGGVLLRTRQRTIGSRVVERLGLGKVVFDIHEQDGALLYRQSSMSVAGIPLPGAIAPHVEACATPVAQDAWDVDVRITWRAHLVCRYAGHMVRA